MTGGLYFLYKKYVKQEQVFNSYGLFQDKAVEEINENARYLNNRYGDSREIADHIKNILIQKDEIIKKRAKSDTRVAIYKFATFITIFFLFGGFPVNYRNIFLL